MSINIKWSMKECISSSALHSTMSLHTLPPPTPADDVAWSKGDFGLISADNVAFRVPSYYLQCWS